MKSDPFLMIPGPTPVPQAILEVLARPPIGHRSGEFKAVLKSVYPKLQWVFQTKNPVFIYSASGTGAMEAALVNVLNHGDEVLVLSCGVFSGRWAEIAKSLGIIVHLQEADPGQPHDAEELKTFLNSALGQNVKAVCLIHNETSTGVLNPLADLSQIIRENSDALIIVDTVTSLGATEFKMDDWGIDIAVSGSQKGFMLPPGLSFIAVSDRAMKAHEQCTTPGYYFHFGKHVKNIDPGQTPYTPALGLIRGLETALDLMQAETLEGVFSRHRLNQTMVREAAKALGLELFVPDERFASPSVTAIVPPADISVDDIRAGLRNRFSITVANGQKELLGKIFRIGHLGAIFPRDVMMTLSALEVVLHELGYNATPFGTGVGAAQKVMVQCG